MLSAIAAAARTTAPHTCPSANRTIDRSSTLLAVLLAVSACAPVSAHRTAPAESAAPSPHPVKHGRLSIIDGHLCGSDGKPVQLCGMSMARLQWYHEVVNDKAFEPRRGLSVAACLVLG